MPRQFTICDVFARKRFAGNQLAVFADAAGMGDEEMQTLAREIHFSETTFVTADKPGPKGWPVRIFTPAREVPFAGHPTLGTAYVIWERFLGRKTDLVTLDLGAGQVPVAVEQGGERLVMTQLAPEFGAAFSPRAAAAVLGLDTADIDSRYECTEVSTGLWFGVIPVKTLDAMRRIRVNLAEYYRLGRGLESKAFLAFAPQAESPDCDLHVRVFCDYYHVPEDPATGSANGCLCAWLVQNRFGGAERVELHVEQGTEMGRPSRLYLNGVEEAGRITVRVGGGVIVSGRGELDA